MLHGLSGKRRAAPVQEQQTQANGQYGECQKMSPLCGFRSILALDEQGGSLRKSEARHARSRHVLAGESKPL